MQHIELDSAIRNSEAVDKEPWSLDDRIEMVKRTYTLGSIRLASTSFPKVVRPTPSVIHYNVHKFERTGSVQNIMLETREKRAAMEDTIGRVLKDLKEDPHLSLRQRETKLGIHRSTLSRIITEQGFHPYRPSLLLDLQQSHKDNRVAMCKMFLDKLDSEPSFMDNMWFSDECRFSLDRVVNKKDCVYYASTNPHWTIDVSHSYQSSHV